MNFRASSFLFLFAALLMLNCSTGPDFERDSIHDPKSDDFELKMPKGENYEIKSDGNVVLTWKDNEDIEDGYRIFKQLGINAEPQFLTQLPENATSFIDSTKNFTFPTTYYVVSYYQNIHSDTLEIDIDFGNLSKFTTEFDNGYEKIILKWSGNIPFANGYEIRSKRDSNASDEVISRVSNTTSKFVINTPNQGFNYEYSITPYKIYDGKITYLESLVSQISIGPVITNLDLLTPDSLQIKWKNLTTSEESFELVIESSASTKSYFADKGTWNTIVNNDFEKDEIYTVKIRAFDSNHSTPFADKKLTINPPKTSITNIIGESNTQVTLQINNPSGIRREHTVYRATNTSDFIEIGTIPKGDITFTDNSLNQNNEYNYYISSPLSDNSPTVSTIYRKNLKFVKRYNLDFNHNFMYKYFWNSNYDTKQLILSNKTSKGILLVDYLTNTQTAVFDFNVSPHEIQLHPQNNLISIVEVTSTHRVLSSIYQNTKTKLDSVEVGMSTIGNINFLWESILYVKKEINSDLHLISTSYDGKQKDTLVTFSSDTRGVNYKMNYNKTELLLVVRDEDRNLELQNYSISDSTLQLISTFTLDEYPINYSVNFESVMISKSQYNISVLDLSSNTTTFSKNFSLYSSNELRNSFFIDDNLIYVPDQSGAYLVDIQNDSDPIVQKFDFDCCSTTFAGAFFDVENQYFIDMRNHHTSSIPDYYSVYSLESYWQEFDKNLN